MGSNLRGPHQYLLECCFGCSDGGSVCLVVLIIYVERYWWFRRLICYDYKDCYEYKEWYKMIRGKQFWFTTDEIYLKERTPRSLLVVYVSDGGGLLLLRRHQLFMYTRSVFNHETVVFKSGHRDNSEYCLFRRRVVF